ncbi:hypothetical protein BASA61_001574 [Batrachochytrium salamandrivorans]|nr:hypothetical protein BASA61_001574 [Batrachochytrium salamandrivorans]
MQFSAASYCSAVHKTSIWDCGELCGGVTAGTTILASFKHNISSITGTGVGMVTVNHNISTIVVIFRGTALHTDDWKSDMHLNRKSGSWFNTLWDYSRPKPSNPGGEIVAPKKILLHSGFSANYQGIYRVTRIHDPIPRVPPKMLGYKHFGQEYYIRKDNVTVVCTPTKKEGLLGTEMAMQISILALSA